MKIFKAYTASNYTVFICWFFTNTANSLMILFIFMSFLHFHLFMLTYSIELFIVLTNLSVCLFTKKSYTVFSSTKAFSISSLLAVHIIIKWKLLFLFYILYCKDTYTNLSIYIPFLRLTIRITAMIN